MKEDNSMYCRNCGEKIPDDAKICPKCGAKQVDDTPQTVFCKHCGAEIDADCIICPNCGKQVQELKGSTPNIVINNSNTNTNTSDILAGAIIKKCNKWVSFFLCLFLGFLGAHKFYEGRPGKGVLYLLTVGLFGIGWIYDTIVILFKPNPYYVYRT